jgi:hypothetical protein
MALMEPILSFIQQALSNPASLIYGLVLGLVIGWYNGWNTTEFKWKMRLKKGVDCPHCKTPLHTCSQLNKTWTNPKSFRVLDFLFGWIFPGNRKED